MALGCRCNERQADDNRAEVFGLLEGLDLQEFAEQASVIPGTAARAVRHMQKAERAERLELGRDVAALYRNAAERDRAQAAMARLDERTARDDWAELVDRARREFVERDGPALVEEAKGRVRLTLLEMESLSANEAAETMANYDESLDRLHVDGLNGIVRQLRAGLERWRDALETPEIGRQAAVDDDGGGDDGDGGDGGGRGGGGGGGGDGFNLGQVACVAFWSAIAAGLLLACIIALFCWCCAANAIAGWYAGEVFRCLQTRQTA
jgi:hypothetical protein